MAHSLRIAAAVVVLACSAVPAERDLGLPSDLAGYQKWTPLLKSPYQVPADLWVLCQAPTPPGAAAKPQKYGPHTGRFIRVYGNPAASAAFASDKRTFPAGAVIVKEKLASASQAGASQATPVGVAFMIKRKESEFPLTGGWEFLFFPSSGEAKRTHEECASCHRKASIDYVFGSYPRE